MFFNKFTTLSELGAEEGKHGVVAHSKALPVKLSLSTFSDGALDGADGEPLPSGGDAEFEKLIKGEYKAAFNKKCQHIIDRRFKETKELESFRKSAEPLIRILSKRFGSDSPEKIASALEEYFSASANKPIEEKIHSDVPLLPKDGFDEKSIANGENANGAKLPVDENTPVAQKLPNDENISVTEIFSGGTGPFDDVENSAPDDMENRTFDDAENSASGDVENRTFDDAENSTSDDMLNKASDKTEKRFAAAIKRYRAADGIYEKILSEAEEAKALYPSFDLARECESKSFCALISSGISVRDAYEASHKDTIIGEAMEYTARAVSEALSRNIMHKGRRPSENALFASSNFPSKRSVSSMSDGEIREILEKVKSGARITF